MLNNPNPNSHNNEKGIVGYISLDCSQETTQTMSVIYNSAFIDFVKWFDSESSILIWFFDLHVYSTEPCINPFIEIDSRKKCPERLCRKTNWLRIFAMR